MRINGQLGTKNYSVKVYVDDVILGFKASCKVINHSPTGFQWGYGGSGPAQLALALLLLRTDNVTATRLHQEFKWMYVSQWPKDKEFCVEIDVDSFIKNRGGKIEAREEGLGADDDGTTFGECTFPERCQKAMNSNCNCSCGGVNHKTQTIMF